MRSIREASCGRSNDLARRVSEVHHLNENRYVLSEAGFGNAGFERAVRVLRTPPASQTEYDK